MTVGNRKKEGTEGLSLEWLNGVPRPLNVPHAAISHTLVSD